MKLSLLRVVVALAAPVSAITHAQPIPAVTRIVVPYAPGGATDYMARVLAEKLPAFLGGSVVVENRAGANGTIAAQVVMSAPPDGSVLFLPAASVLVINPHLYKDLNYNAVNDFAPVARLTIGASALVISAEIPATSMSELVAWSRARKQPLRIGSAGKGGISHMWIEQFRAVTKLDVTHVPYKGGAPAVADVIGGHIEGTFQDYAAVLPAIQSKKVKLIGIVGNQRNPAAPDVPTLAEQGFPGVDGLSWFGVLAPAKAPPETVRRVSEAFARALADKESIDKFASVGMSPAYQPPGQFRDLIRTELAWWGKLITEHKISGD